MTTRSKTEWLEWYKERAGCENLELAPDELILFHPEHGFMAFFIDGDVFGLHHLCGDGKYWQRIIQKIAKFEKTTKIRAFTKRNPEAWIRKYGGRITGYEMECDIDELKV